MSFFVFHSRGVGLKVQWAQCKSNFSVKIEYFKNVGQKANWYWNESGVDDRIVSFNENGLPRSPWVPSEFYSVSAVQCTNYARLNISQIFKGIRCCTMPQDWLLKLSVSNRIGHAQISVEYSRILKFNTCHKRTITQEFFQINWIDYRPNSPFKFSTPLASIWWWSRSRVSLGRTRMFGLRTWRAQW